MQGKADTCMLVKRDDNELMIFLVYVDDILAFAIRDDELLDFKTAVESEYNVKDFADANHFLGLELQWSQSGNELRISQHKYVCSVMKRFGMTNAPSAPTPMEERFRDHLVHSSDTSDFKFTFTYRGSYSNWLSSVARTLQPLCAY